ncbi:hypothetical protein DEO23_00525 [Brachybacterium endophyticum]|uniref:Uncharacterized protein n=1 Tax=Brachybacterium endophyticum TaxID=2182385 RepID=A0A2U2RN17_9MICO|nr:Nramp family divalent metal transporter [Brachybacterium endophyticum]PWH07185.1 hypothetical protein DEO23_00525 [Brachybacterium endophyticum]
MTAPQHQDLGLGELRFPEADPRLKKWTFGNLIAFTGPGMILASVTIGNGEIFSSSRGGAVFGMAIIWTFVLCAIMKAAIVYSGGRYIVLTGEHPFQRWAQIIPGPRNWLALLLGVLAVVCFPSWAVAYFQGLGQWSNWTFHTSIDPAIWGLIWGVIGFATVFLRSFKIVENFQTVVVGLMVVFSFVAVFVSNPPWIEAIKGLVPNVPSDYPGWIKQDFPDVAGRSIPLEIIAYLGALGGGTYDYIGYVGSLREKRWGMLGVPDHAVLEEKLNQLDSDHARIPLAEDTENVAEGRAWLRAVKLDVLASFVSVGILAITFLVLGDVVLGTGASQTVPGDDDILGDQAGFFSMISPVLVYLYQIAIWAAFFGSLQALMSTIYPYTVRESFAPSFKALREPRNWQKVRVAVATYTFLGAVVLLFSGLSYTTVISFAGILGGVLSLGVWGFAQLWTEHKVLPKPYRMHRWAQVVVAISSLALFVFGVVAIIQFFQDFLG